MTFTETVIIRIIDGGLIGAAMLLIGYWLNKSLFKFKNEQETVAALEREQASLKNALLQDKRDRILNDIDKQLSEFFYPIFYRLQKDSALWRLSPQLNGQKTGALPKEANDIIEQQHIIKNCTEILNIIEHKSYLIEIDPVFQEQIREYIKHVTIYTTIRKVDSLKTFNPVDFGSPYPVRFHTMIEEKIETLQNQYNQTFDKITHE